jgi:ribosomal protein S18 acetylase RimI-like enzyme
MSAADKPALMRILRHTPEFKHYEVAVAEEVINSYLQDPGGSGYHALVAVNGKQISGFICYGPTPCTVGTWDIYWVAVAGEQRGRGIGGTLTEKAESAIRQESGRLILIETSSSPEYDGARRFYLGRGYENVARIPDFYAPGDDLLIMQKRLDFQP